MVGWKVHERAFGRVDLSADQWVELMEMMRGNRSVARSAGTRVVL